MREIIIDNNGRSYSSKSNTPSLERLWFHYMPFFQRFMEVFFVF